MAVYVFGGSCIDIEGIIDHRVVAHDSNPGEVTISFGGVGHNVALNLANLKEEVHYITVLSDDSLSQAFYQDCLKHGIIMDDTIIIKDRKPSFYVAIQGQSKDMDIAVNDMKLLDELTITRIQKVLGRVKANDQVFVDTNMPQNSLAYLVSHCQARIFVDPVSTFKSVKLKGLLNNIYAIKPNLLEAQKMSGKKTVADIQKWFLKQGVQRLYLSCGDKGVYACDQKGSYHQAPYPTKLVNVTGAGDALMAGIIHQEKTKQDLKSIVSYAMVMSKLTIECEHTINDKINVGLINKYIKEV